MLGHRYNHRIQCFVWVFFVCLLFLKPLNGLEDGNSSERPNFVFVFADDWGWGDLGCYGHSRIRTPHLDRLASEGILYTNFHVASGVCSPSRTAVMTGQYPARLRVHGHFADHQRNAERGMPNFLDPEVPTLTRFLQRGGYRVGHYGKWHLGGGAGSPEPFAYGIDECRINVGNGPPLSFGSDAGEGFSKRKRHQSTQVIIDEAIAFIERNRSASFYLNVWLNDTHAILDPSEEQLSEYQSLRPSQVGDRHTGAPAIYYSVVSSADKHIGRLLRRLGELDLADNTVFLFSSDNGPEDILVRNASHSGVGSTGIFRGRKRSLYNGGICVPFILRWPAGQMKSGVIDNESVLGAVDLLPTFCSMAGVELPTGLELDGEDVSDIFRGKSRKRSNSLMWDWRFAVYGHVMHRSPRLAIRDGKWKLLMNPDNSRIELYNISEDPGELQDLADTYGNVTRHLSSKLLQWHETLPESPVDPLAGKNDYLWPQ